MEHETWESPALAGPEDTLRHPGRRVDPEAHSLALDPPGMAARGRFGLR
jgi:hypothetical protein